MLTSIHSVHRVTKLATFIIIVFTMTTIFASINVVNFNSKSSSITQILYDQLKFYEKISKIVNSETVQFDSAGFTKRYNERRIQQLLSNIDSLEAARKQLIALKPEKMNFFFIGPGWNEKLPIVQSDAKFEQAIKNLKTFVKSSSADFFERIKVQSSDQILPFSVTYFPSKIESSLQMAKEQAQLNLKMSYYLIAGSGVFLIFMSFLVRKVLILPAIKNLSRSYEIENRYQSEINKQKALVTKAIMSFPDITVVFNKDAEVLASNEAFNTFCKDAGKSDSPVDVFSTPLTKRCVQERNIQKLADKLNSVDLIEIADKTISWRCVQEVSGIWVFIGRDQTAFTTQQEEKQHAERLEVIGRMASGIAHDFNNILGGILLRAELALDKIDEDIDHRDIYEGFIESSLRAKSLISQLLSYSRRQILTPSVISSHRLERALCTNLMVPKNIKLKVTNLCDLSAEFDLQHCITAIENIVQNSILAIGKEAGKIDIILDTCREDNILSLAIKVYDTGGGFSPDALQSATDPFFTTRSPTHGSGLGLAMVSGFVAQTGGKLYIKNKTEGALVEICFPATSNMPAQAPVRSTTGRFPHGGKASGALKKKGLCILLEDDLVLGKLLSKFLEKYFDRVEYFNNAELCTEEMAGFENVSAAIFDWNLPDGTSEQAVTLCRSLHPEAMIVLSSGNVDEQIQSLADRLCAYTSQKPFSLIELSEVMGLARQDETFEMT